MIFNFPKLVKQLLSDYPDYDYSVLNTRLFMSCWLTFSLDSSVTSMRGLFRKLNLGGTSVDQSTFSKANQHRSSQPFETLYKSLNCLVKKRISLLKTGIFVQLTPQPLPSPVKFSGHLATIRSNYLMR